MPQHALDELSVARCWDLLHAHSLGRLSLSLKAMPAILPVRYALHGRDIIIGLDDYEVPNQAVDHTVAAFSVDAFDLTESTGWSVHVLGEIHRSSMIGIDRGAGVVTADQIACLTPATITGRRAHLRPIPPNVPGSASLARGDWGAGRG